MKKKIFYDANDNLDGTVCTGAELMDGLSNTVRTISRDHDTDVIFAGDGACTDGDMVILPSIAQDAEISKRDANVMLGYGGHESLHKLLTDFDRIKPYFRKWQRKKKMVTKHMNNAIEDVRIENGGGVLYNGMHKSIDQTAEAVNKKYLEVYDADPTIADDWARVMPVAVTWAGRKALGYATPLNEQCLQTLPSNLRKQAEQIAKQAMGLEHGVTGMGTVNQQSAYDGCIAAAKLAEKVVKKYYKPKQQEADEQEQEKQREQWRDTNPGQGTPTNGGSDGEDGDDQEADGADGTSGDNPNGNGSGNQSDGGKGGSQGDDDTGTTGDGQGSGDEEDNQTDGELDEDTEQDEQPTQGSDEQDQGDGSQQDDDDDGATEQDGDQDGSEDSGETNESGTSDEQDGDTNSSSGQDSEVPDERATQDDIEQDEPSENGGGYGATMQEEPDWTKVKANEVDEEQDVFDPNLNQVIEELAKAVNDTTQNYSKKRVFSPSSDIIATRHTHPVLNNDPTYKKRYEREKKKVSGTLGTIRRVLERVLLAQDQTSTENGKRTGRLDLKRNSVAISQFKRNVFTQKVDETYVNSAVTMLVDCSGSMHDQPIRLAMQCAMSIAEALEPIGIPLEVLGHTTISPQPQVNEQMREYINKQMYKRNHKPKFSRFDSIVLWVFKQFDEALAICRSGIAFMPDSCHGANADPDAIIMSAKRLLDRREDKKILLVLSDGRPAFSTEYNDEDQQTRDAVEWCVQQGILLVGIGIMDDSVRAYYPDYVVCNDLKELPTTVIQELRNLLMSTKKNSALINASKSGVKSIAQT